jgi:hypothetical protein
LKKKNSLHKARSEEALSYQNRGSAEILIKGMERNMGERRD